MALGILAATVAFLPPAAPAAASDLAQGLPGGIRLGAAAASGRRRADLNRDEVLRKTFAAEVNGGVAVAGCGLRGSGPPDGTGTITITGIPAGARILKAILNWTIMGDAWPEARATLETPGGAAVDLVGTPLGEDDSPCWPLPWIYGFTADACGALSTDGNGVYTVRIPDSGDIDQAPSAEGATLIIAWEHPSAPRRDIVVYEGLETQDEGSTVQTVDGFDYTLGPRFADAWFVVSDGQGEGGEDSGRALVNGYPVLGPYFDGDDGAACSATPEPRYYDVDRTDIAFVMDPGDTSLAAEVESGPGPAIDCLTWTAFVALIGTDTAPGLAGCPAGPCPPLTVANAGSGHAICDGETAVLDGARSSGCAPGDHRYRWLDGASPVCDWSASPACAVAPSLTTTYRLEVACSATLDCLSADEATVAVSDDSVPPSLGNTLMAIRIDGNVLLGWRPEPLARAYSLYRGTARDSWPGTPFQAGLPDPAAVDVEAVAAPPSLYTYRVAGTSCSGREGR